jgi:hypothetical protein
MRRRREVLTPGPHPKRRSQARRPRPPRLGKAPKVTGPAPMERRNHRSFDASKGLHRVGDRGVGIVDGVVASLLLS